MDATPDHVSYAGRASTSHVLPSAPVQPSETEHAASAGVAAVQFVPRQAEPGVAGSRTGDEEMGTPTADGDIVAGPVLSAVARVDRLAAAWEVVRSNDASDGVYRDSTMRFAEQLTGNLDRISAALLSGGYRPGVLNEMTIPKQTGGVRRLQLSQIDDLVVERALAEALTEGIDEWMSPWSFAYRPATSVGEALRVLREAQANGATHVARTDIADCFPSIDRGRVLARLAGLVPDPSVVALIARLLDRPVRVNGKLTRQATGLPQGSPLSPLLCNLALDDLDRELILEGRPAIRFGDDLAIAATSEPDAREALDVARQAGHALGLTLNETKTDVMSFAEGFCFLGEDLVADDSPAPERLSRPGRRTLYAGTQGSLVAAQRGRIIVTKGDAQLLDVPQAHVGRIVLFGAVGITSGLRSVTLNSGIDVAILSARGTYLGALTGWDATGASRRRRQYRLTETNDFAVPMARAIVKAKIANMRCLLQRYVRRESAGLLDRPIQALDDAQRTADKTHGINALRGVEGAATRAYWDGFAALMPEGVVFPGRRRRPPTDLVNAALSLGYTLLTSEAAGALAAAGLDPAAGILHTDQDRRASLALDLIEEFRPLVVDTVALTLVRRRMITPDDVTADPNGGVRFTDAARTAVLTRFESRMLTVFGNTVVRARTSYRRALHLQANAIASSLRRGRPDYHGLRWR